MLVGWVAANGYFAHVQFGIKLLASSVNLHDRNLIRSHTDSREDVRRVECRQWGFVGTGDLAE